MQELSREQESKIASLALSCGSVQVDRPKDDGTVRVQAGGRVLVFDEDGNEEAEEIHRMYFPVPLSLVRAVLGDERVDEALGEARDRSVPDHYLGVLLGGEMLEALEAMAENQARPTHWDKSLPGAR